jgi:hypothetical protein
MIPPRYKKGIPYNITLEDWQALDETEKQDMLSVHRVMQKWERKKEKKPEPKKRR